MRIVFGGARFGAPIRAECRTAACHSGAFAFPLSPQSEYLSQAEDALPDFRLSHPCISEQDSTARRSKEIARHSIDTHAPFGRPRNHGFLPDAALEPQYNMSSRARACHGNTRAEVLRDRFQ